MPPSVINLRDRPSLAYLWKFNARHPIEIQGRRSQAPQFCLALRGGTRKIEGNTFMGDAGISEVPQEQERDLVSFLLTECDTLLRGAGEWVAVESLSRKRAR
jgi:hypothetical protein